MKTLIKKDTCNSMFLAALFTVAKTWKQPKCPINRQMDKEDVVYIYIYIYNGILLSYIKKKNESLQSVATWMY